MHFDALTLAAVVHELRETLLGGRVQQVVLPDAHSVGLEVYAQRQRRYLLLSAEPGAGRVHLAADKLRRGVEKESPLLLLLRKYVRDAILDAISQPDPTERVLELTFDHPGHGVTTLVAEPMGRLSNLFLLNPARVILECVHRVRPGAPRGGSPLAGAAQRVLLPGRPYMPPPRRGASGARLPPWDDGRPDYAARLAAITEQSGPLWRAIADTIAGASPSLAREIAWLATGDGNAPAQTATVPGLRAALQTVWSPLQSGEWSPGVILEGGRAVGYAPYVVHFRPGYAPRPSISAAIAEATATGAVGDGPVTHDAYAALRSQTTAQIARARRRVERQAAAAAGDLPDPDAAARLRVEAEWLLALSSHVAPGQTELVVELGEGEPLRIRLDPARSPVEQAQAKFKRAGKLDRAAEFVPTRRARLDADLAFLDQLATDLALAENQPEIAAVAAALAGSGLLPQRPTQAKVARPAAPQLLRVYSPEGFEIVVGRNAVQNDYLTFTVANAADLWLHVRDAPGSHVVIRSGGRPVDDATLGIAAQLAAYYSKRRGDRAVPVAATQKRFVTRVPGGRPGQVYLRDETTLTVSAVLPEDALPARRGG
jgi:predicted ribosome quality control (RQC) complex YloA/Tae2 family protein